MIKRHWFKGLVIASFIILLFWKGCEVTHIEKPEPVKQTKIDTVSTPFIPEVVKPNVAPKEKKIYKKKEKVLRDSAEKKDIILDVKIIDNHIIEDVIDTAGTVNKKTFDIPIKLEEDANGETPKEVLIDQEGKVEVKKKTRAGRIIQGAGKIAKKAGKGIVIGLAVVGVVTIAIVASGG